MANRPLKSTAKRYKPAPGPNQQFRDRKRITINGEKHDVVAYGHTKAAATAALHRKVADLIAKAEAVTAATFTQVMAQLLRHKRKVRGRKRSTIHSDAGIFRRYIKPSIGDKPVDQVTLTDLQAIQHQLVDAGHYRTAEMTTILLRSIYRFALRTYSAEIRAGRLLLFDIAGDLEPITRPAEARFRKAEAWTREEIGQFLAAAKAKYDRSRSNLVYPLLQTAAAAGLRRGELLGLRRQDLITTGDDSGPWWLNVERQYVVLRGRHHLDTPKTAAGTRQVPIGQELAKVLQAHMRKLDLVAAKNPAWQPTDLLFPSYNGQPMQPRNIYRALAQIVDELGLEPVRLHDLRGFYATYLMQELYERKEYSHNLVMQVMGQSDPEQVLRHYARVIQDDLVKATFDPTPGDALAKSLAKPRNEKDALPVESAS